MGASAGQYASDREGFETDALVEAITDQEPPELHPDRLLTADSDPNLHATKRKPSYGVQSRLSVRAIVVQGTNGAPVALVKSDNYLAQDLLVRRVGQLLAKAGSQRHHRPHPLQRDAQPLVALLHNARRSACGCSKT